MPQDGSGLMFGVFCEHLQEQISGGQKYYACDMFAERDSSVGNASDPILHVQWRGEWCEELQSFIWLLTCLKLL